MAITIKNEYLTAITGEVLNRDKGYDPKICFCCKKQNHDLFMVSEEDWINVVPEGIQSRIVCWACYSKFRKEKNLKLLNYEDFKLK